jgi:hypothetical protein
MKIKFYALMLVSAFLLSLNLSANHHGDKKSGGGKMRMMDNVKVAENWVTASYTSKDRLIRMVENHMADDGINYPGRFIGFGFNWNPQDDDMTVERVVAGSPADGVLQIGDVFVSVNGVKATKENIDNGKLEFAGLPGEPVKAVVKREGKSVKISVERGMVSQGYTKEQVLENINSANADEWGTVDYEVYESAVNRKNRTIYVLSWNKQLDDRFDLEAESYAITRFTFNKEGKVTALRNMSEELLVQSQLGFKVTR